jgi:hypothetical protein
MERKAMKKVHLPRWPVVLATLLAPAALQAQAATVVCKDGSNGPNASACASHGGVDSVSTTAAQKARGAAGVETGQVDTTARDTGQAGMQTDTALKAKPGLQTGPRRGDSANVGPSDTSMTPSATDTTMAPNAAADTALRAKPGVQTGKPAHPKKSKRHHKRAAADSMQMQADTTMTRPDSTH